MKKELWILLFLIGTMAVLSACGNVTRDLPKLNQAIEEQQIEQHQKIEKEQNKIDIGQNSPASPTLSEFEKGVFIDFDMKRDPLLNDQIKVVLKKYLDAKVHSDEKTFRSTFKDSKTADAYMWSYDGDYKFTDINHISKDETKNHVLVTVEGEMIRENKVEDAAVTLYFVSDQEGEWSIIAVD